MGAAPATPATPSVNSPDADLLRALAHRIDQTDSGAFNNLGVLFFSKGLHADAVDAFLRALALDGRMRTAARNLEIAAARPGACDARIAALDARLADNAEDHNARRERARLLRLIGRLTDSIHQLDALIAENPDDADALLDRGLVELRGGDLRRAQRWFERSVNANEIDTVARLYLAEVLYQRGQNEQALNALDELLAIDNAVADAHLLRGFVLGDMGHQHAAMEATNRANTLKPSLQMLESHLSIDNAPIVASVDVLTTPDGALARYGLGLAFRQRGYFDQARQEFARSLSNGEEPRFALHAIAELDILDGQFDRARDAYQNLVASYPEHPRYWNEFGVSMHQAGKLAEAAEAYRTALRHDPRYALAYNNLGVALADLGDHTAAREAFVRSRELNVSQITAPLNLARWFQQQHDYLAALTLVRELVAFHSRHAAGWFEMGLVLKHLERPREARDAFVSAIECRETHAESRYELAAVLNVLGDADGALRETQRALELAPVRIAPRMVVGIDVQDECPDACGEIDLLSLRSASPLSGVVVSATDVMAWLPDRQEAATQRDESVAAADPATASRTARLQSASMMCDDADRFATMAVYGEAIDRYRSARECFEPEHQLPPAPNYSEWRRAALGEARSLCLLGRAPDALALLTVLGTQNSRDAEVLVLFARASAAASCSPVGRRGSVGQSSADSQTAQQHASVARRAILQVLRQEPPSAALMHFAGDAALDIDDAGLALACFRRALALDPTRPSPRVAIARLLRARGDFLAARLELAAALSAAPGWREAVLELAQVLRESDRPQEALVLVTRHLTSSPTDIDALILLAEVLMRIDRDTDCRIAVMRILRHDTENPAALWLDGLLLSRQSRIRDAVDRWRRVATQSVDNVWTAQAKQAIADHDPSSLRLVS